MTRPTEITLYIDDINAADLRDAMAEVKRNLRREEGQRDHVMQSWGMVLPMGEDGRIEDLVSDWDGSPRITDVRNAFEDSRVDRVSFDCQCYWIDNDIPMADRWDNLEPLGSYASVTVCRGADPLPDELVDAACRRETCSRDYSDFLIVIGNGRYIPTLNIHPADSDQAAKDIQLIRDRLKRDGLPMWPENDEDMGINRGAGEIDEVVGRISGFKSYGELVTAIKQHGYTPTVRADAEASPQRREDGLKLRAALKADGLPMYPETLEEVSQ